MTHMDPIQLPFPRTTCACPDDIASCTRRPGMLMPSDLGPISRALVTLGWINKPPASALTFAHEVGTYLRATPGALVAQKLGDGSLLIRDIPTISPVTTESGRCIFLSDTDRCLIHTVAPAGCAYFDVHMNKEEADKRSAVIHRIIDADQDYAAYRATLIEERYDD